MKKIILSLIVIMATITQIAAQNRVYSVNVVEVIDGDTLRLKFSNDFEFDARLQGIDAPESGQAFGKECRNDLKRLVESENLRIWIIVEDKYNRKIVKLFRDDYSEINLDMIINGCAWLASPRRSEKAKYEAAYKEARNKKKGLWSESEPCNPRKFRAGKCS